MTDDETLLRVAWLYHVEGLTQEAIAAANGISRAKVIKLLQQALDTGVVSIQLSANRFKSFRIARELERTFELREALVVPTPNDVGQLTRVLGTAGALHLQSLLDDGMTVATAWGSTLLEVAKALPRLELDNVSVVMMLGGLSRSLPALNPNDIARRVAEATGGRMFSLFAPALVDDPALRDRLLEDRNVKAPLDLVRASQVALLGAGATGAGSTLLRNGVLSDTEMQALRAKGAVGDLLARFYDIDGKPVNTPLTGRVVGLELHELRAIPRTILVAGGDDKVEPVLGALRGKYVNTLITDEGTASRLVELEGSRASAN